MPSHILIVDDDPSIRAALAELLEEEGYTVESVTNGAEALAAIARAQPRAVLLDMRMPVLDGWGFAKALAERGIDLPVIVMTAAQEARQWGREIGATRVLAKPFDLDEVLDAIASTVGQGQG
jgi:two-component system chemotaxis response regulator CheY